MKALPVVPCPAVDRVDLAWICVATNDPHPLHLDHEFARAAGYRDVVVPAHFLIGWIGQYLEEWCGKPEHVIRWEVRFTAPVWPGDRLELRGSLQTPGDEPSDRRLHRLHVDAHNQDGVQVGVAVASVLAPDP